MKNRVKQENNPHAWVLAKRETKVKRQNIILETLTDYCSHSSLHGIGYLGGKDKTFTEKVWWLIIFSISVSSCFYLITITYIKWQHNPVILSFEKEQTPIWAIPFPAVTICPVNKVRQTVYNYTEMFRRRHNLAEDEYKRFWDISLVCNLDQYDDNFDSKLNITDEDAIRNIFQVAPTMNQILYHAKWQNKKNSSLFAEHLNKEGLCFTFNALSQNDMFTKELDKDIPYINHGRHTKWTMEDGYDYNSNMDDYPHRTAQDGFGSGLSFMLYSYVHDIDYVCGMRMAGYKIVLHNPVETAKAAQQYFVISSDRKATIMVKPELTTTHTTLRSLSAHGRKCYFSNEKSLRFFKIYTQNNCRLECDANVSEQYCGCVPYYMPRDEQSLICGFGKLKCLKEIEGKILDFQMMEKGINTSEEDMETTEYKIFDDCDCLPACNNLQFTAEISHTKIHFVQATLASGLWNSDISDNEKKELSDGTLQATQVDIFFKDSQFLALRRSELYGTTDFVANCGGLLGLFMGFSLLSLAEIFYFLTLKMWCKIRHRNRN